MSPETNSQFPNSTPPVLDSNKNNKVILATILILVIAGAYLLYWYLGTQAFPNPNQESPNAIQERDEMLDWKTYRNEELGFEFKYPNEVYLEELEMLSSSATAFYLKLGYKNSVQLLLAQKNDELLDLKDFILQPYISCTPGPDGPCFDIPKIDSFKLESIEGLNIENKYYFQQKGVDRFVYIFYAIRIQYNEHEEIFNQILSTFKFISTSTSQIDTSDWKTYRNEEYGFEFKYPSDWVEDQTTIVGDFKLIPFVLKKDLSCDVCSKKLTIYLPVKPDYYGKNEFGEGVISQMKKEGFKEVINNELTILFKVFDIAISGFIHGNKLSIPVEGALSEETFHNIINTFKFTK